MDFFKSLSKKATETYQYTKEKAANLSEELKIRGKINDLKGVVEDLYIEIGKTVYTDVKDGKTVAEEEIIKKCNEISEKNDEISKLKEKLLTLRKMKTCPNCGAKIDNKDMYCSKCGKEQPKVENVEVEQEEPNGVQETEVVDVSDVENGESEDKKED